MLNSPTTLRSPLDHRYRREAGGCPIEAALDVLGGRWKSLLLLKIWEGERRFSDLRRSVPHVSPRMLARQLRELERDGLLTRIEHAPTHVEYSLTPVGAQLGPILLALRNWGDDYLAANDSPSTTT